MTIYVSLICQLWTIQNLTLGMKTAFVCGYQTVGEIHVPALADELQRLSVTASTGKGRIIVAGAADGCHLFSSPKGYVRLQD